MDFIAVQYISDKYFTAEYAEIAKKFRAASDEL